MFHICTYVCVAKFVSLTHLTRAEIDSGGCGEEEEKEAKHFSFSLLRAKWCCHWQVVSLHPALRVRPRTTSKALHNKCFVFSSAAEPSLACSGLLGPGLAGLVSIVLVLPGSCVWPKAAHSISCLFKSFRLPFTYACMYECCSDYECEWECESECECVPQSRSCTQMRNYGKHQASGMSWCEACFGNSNSHSASVSASADADNDWSWTLSLS